MPVVLTMRVVLVILSLSMLIVQHTTGALNHTFNTRMANNTNSDIGTATQPRNTRTSSIVSTNTARATSSPQVTRAANNATTASMQTLRI